MVDLPQAAARWSEASRVGTKRNVDWVAVAEAIACDDTDSASWARGVLEAMRPFHPGAAMAFACLEHTSTFDAIELRFVASDAEFAQLDTEMAMLRSLDVAHFRALYYPDQIVCTLGAVRRRMPRVDALEDYLQGHRLQDGIGIIVHPEPNVAVVLSASRDEPCTIDRASRRVLEQVGLHIESKMRLRRRPQSLRAVIRPDGRVVHHTPKAPAAALLSRHVLDVERARSRKHRSQPHALNLWRALIAGTVSLVERAEGSSRFYLVVENAPTWRGLRALSPREVDVLGYAARGLSSKLIAYALGLSEATISSRLANAARKMGTASRTDLVRVAAILTQDPRSAFDEAILTKAELEILAYLKRGLSNGESAAARSRSTRTIAHQVSRLLEKTNSPSRRALVARSGR